MHTRGLKTGKITNETLKYTSGGERYVRPLMQIRDCSEDKTSKSCDRLRISR